MINNSNQTATRANVSSLSLSKLKLEKEKKKKKTENGKQSQKHWRSKIIMDYPLSSILPACLPFSTQFFDQQHRLHAICCMMLVLFDYTIKKAHAWIHKHTSTPYEPIFGCLVFLYFLLCILFPMYGGK